MGGTFSSKKKSKPPPPRGATITPIDKATLDLKVSRDKLSKYRKKLELDTDKLAIRAKASHAEGKTKNALQLLRLRKYKLQEADRLENQLLTVYQMIDKISEKQNEQEVLEAMKQGKDALGKMHEQMKVDDILDIMDEIRDQDEVENRINEALGEEGLRVMEGLGEEDMLVEFAKLEEEVRLEAGKHKAPEMKKMEDEEMDMPLVPKAPLPFVPEPENPENVKVAVAS